MLEIEYLRHFNIILFASVIVVTLFRFCNLSPVLGYFVAGTIIAKFVPKGVGMTLFAELGIVFLLFLIGLELTIARLMSMKKYVFGFGVLQFVITSCIFYLFSSFIFEIGTIKSFIISTGFALSSTAIVLQVIQESGRQTTQDGRLSLANLLLQDLAVVPLLVLIPLLTEATDHKTMLLTIVISMIKGLVSVFSILVVGRIVLRPIFKSISSLKSSELFISTTLLLIISLAYFTHQLGLSLALGAFLGGLLVAETEYRDEVEQVVLPFKSLLLGLFFMTVGMSVNFDALLENIYEIGLLSILIIIIKSIVIFCLAIVFGFRPHVAVRVSLLMSQGGEFAFILFGLAKDQGIFQADLTDRLLLCVTTTMALTPLLAIIGDKIASLLVVESSICGDRRSNSEFLNEDSHVIVIGFSNLGRRVAKILNDSSISYVGLDISPEVTDRYRSKGYPILRCDATKKNSYILSSAANAKAIVITLKNCATVDKAIAAIKEYTGTLKNVIVITSDFKPCINDNDIDKNLILSANLETSLVVSDILFKEFFGMSDDESYAHLNKYRLDEYKSLKNQ